MTAFLVFFEKKEREEGREGRSASQAVMAVIAVMGAGHSCTGQICGRGGKTKMNNVIDIGTSGQVPPTKAGPSQDLLTVEDMARELRCSKPHVYNIINGTVSGVSPLPVITMGRRVVARRKTFERWKIDNERSRA